MPSPHVTHALLVAAAATLSAGAQPIGPTLIAGGRFEASGVVGVPHTSGVLFVDDGNGKQIFWMKMDLERGQQSAAEAVSLGVEIVDPEDIATDGVMFYVVGSQSRRTDRGADLIRFAYEPSTGRLTKVATLHGLGQLLQRELLELDASSTTHSRLNIEGLAWEPHARALLLGLRSPVVKGYALVIPLHLRESKDPSRLEADAAAPIRLPLNGQGVRGFGYEAETGRFLILAGSEQPAPFRLLEWNGPDSTEVREVTRFAAGLKPEGITSIGAGPASNRLIVFDDGRYEILRNGPAE
jgi:uncharacterized protein DUF3616